MTRPPPAPKYAPLARARVVVVGDACQAAGRAIALLLAERGHAVLATGHDAAAMSDLPRETAQGGILDVAPTRGPIARAMTLFGRVDALVVTPPSLVSGPFADVSSDALLAPLSTLLTLVHDAIPLLARADIGTSGAGRVVLVAPPLAPASVACAVVRAALDALAESLRDELAPKHIGITTVATELGRVARRRPTALALAEIVLKALAAPRPKPRYVLKVGGASKSEG